MIAIALGLLALSATMVLGAFGASAADLQLSAERVAIAAVIGVLAPLFWPGAPRTPRGAIFVVVGWSSAVALLAALALLVAGAALQSLERTAVVCLVLWLVMLVTHAVASALETLLATRVREAQSAREAAGRLAAVVLALLGSLPLWFGPAAELLGHAGGVVDAAIGVSPLTHLAVASGNDLLRNQWFYQHSNLAALRYSYPALSTITAAYVALVLTFALLPLLGRWLRSTPRITTPQLTTERMQ